ncbi:PCDHD1 [Mytilus coruscus]|uniref:PCDHD1 n=1 Tax=Mytilus coruscus TaxID=42192 RepID=A0A6J8C4S7_MYTCO|nr:PCDHD1 [Mytilus coruscus]
MAAIYVFQCILLLNFYSIIEGNSVVYNVDETDIPATYIGTISNSTNLKDLAGKDDFGNLKYTFLGTDSQILSLFKIDERTSRLETKGILDRESVCEFTKICSLSLDIAVQSTRTSFFLKIPVTIYVNDLNDNAPVFDKPNITLSLSEASLVGTKVTIDGARDRDTSDAYSLRSYEVYPANTPFSIEFEKKLDGTSIVRLKVEKALDRETQSSYQLEIVAKDGGSPPQSGTLFANIIITDVNDNPPNFEKTQYDITVKEDINISSVIGTIKAVDLDEGDNGKVTYRLSSHQSDTILNLFSIDHLTGQLRVSKKLSYVPGKKYQIIIEASDTADQPLTSQTRVIVVVEDVGNSAPVIVVNLLSGSNVAHISEYANKGTAVAHIAVHDDDTGDNGNVYCTMKSDYFELMLLGNKEYNVVVKQKLDRETIPNHQVTISCQDNGKPPFNVSSEFNIEIDDENDSPPKFSSIQYTETIFEGNKKGDVIVQVFAIDSDQGKNAEIYYFLDNEASLIFSVDSTTGVVRAAIELDREQTPTITTKIFAIDQGKSALTGTAEIKVKILDLNDNSPKFKKEVFQMEVFENKESGIEIGQLFAQDLDEGDNAEIVFNLPTGTPIDLPFLVLPHGQITTNKVLDRETQPSYGFYVIAYDLGYPPRTSTASVVVTVKDMNDHRPEIKGPNYANNTFSISQSSKAGRIITTVVAYDKDKDKNSDLVFSILNTATYFSIDPKSGAIFLEKDIDVKPGTSFSLEIEVSDEGVYPQKSFLTLTVVVGTGEQTAASNTTNMVIVIVLVSLTIVASTIIIAVIIFLRRVDRNAKASKTKSDYYSGGTVIDPSVTVFSLPDDSILCSDKKKKKEVSFSIDDDQDHIGSLQLPTKTDHPFDKMFVDKDKRQGDDSHSIGSTSDSGRGNSDDETSRSPHSTGNRTQHKGRQGKHSGNSDTMFSPRKISHSQPLLYSPSKMNEQHGSRPLKFHTDNPRNIFHFDQQENGPTPLIRNGTCVFCGMTCMRSCTHISV